MDKLIKIVELDGVIITPLRIIDMPKGKIMHGIKCIEDTFDCFGEAYFSFVNYNDIKGWKKHTKMLLNIVVPVGNIKFVLFDDREGSLSFGKFYSVTLGEKNYQRLTVSPNIWVGFKGLDPDKNFLLNVANMPHDPDEAINEELAFINYDWSNE